MQTGIPPQVSFNTCHAGSVHATSLIRFATKAGVNLMTFDNEEELYKIKSINPSAKLVLRILADDPTAICNVRYCWKVV